MSFLRPSPNLPQAAGTVDAKHNSGYKAADVVALGWGRDLFPSKWVSDKYDKHTQRAGDNRPEWQYCSIAAVYRKGPIDYVGKVFRDGAEITNFNYTFSDGEESHEFTINPSLASGRAWTAVVHRGTSDASTSGVTNLNAQTGQSHPPMRDYVWIEWKNIDLGQNTALPSLAVEFGKKTPAIDEFAAGMSDPYGVNPFAATYALLREATGGDFDSSLFDLVHWGTQAAALEADGVSGRTGDLVHCHPSFTSPITVGDAVSQILAYVDGYLYTQNGKLRVGWFPSAAVDAGALPEISEHDLETKPGGGGFPDWNEGATSVVVVFKSVEKDYGEDAARYNAPANRENNISGDPARKERPFIHDAAQAAAIAAEGASESSSGEITTDLTVFKSRAVDGSSMLVPGDLVNWDYGPHSLDLVCRVIARRLVMGQASDVLTIARERGAFPRPYVAAVDARVAPADDDPGEIDTADVRLWLMPSGLTDLRQIAPLVDRTKRTIYRVDLHLSADGASPWENILDSRFFAAKGAVHTAGIDDNDTTVRITSTSVDFERMAAQSAIGQLDDTLLLLIGDELHSVGTITTISTNVYDLTILRGRRGTTAAAHSVSDVCWLFYRDEIDSVEHQEFYRVRDGSNVYDAGIAEKFFKLQLFTATVDGEAKPDDPGISLVLPDLSADVTTGYTIVLTNEAHTVAADDAGTVVAGQLGSGSTAKTDVKVFRGNTALTAVTSSPNSDQFSIALGTLTNTTATKEDADTVRCDTLTAENGTIAITVSVAGVITITKLFTVAKAYKGTTGATGSTGATGATGDTGPGVVYRGPYSAGGAYSHTSTRRDVVSHGGSYYLANNTGKNGLTTWGTPGVADWASFGATFSSVATDILLTVDATILKTLVMGDGATANAGIIRSNGASAFATGTGYWLNPRNGSNLTEFRVGNPSGAYMSWDGSALIVASASIAAPTITGGLLKMNGASTLCSDTVDGSDTGIIRVNGGGADGVNRGGQLDLLGNEYTTVGGLNGSILLSPGAHANGTVRLRDNALNDRLIISTGPSVDVMGCNQRWFNSGGSQVSRVDAANGDYVTTGGIIYSSRGTERIEINVNGGSLEFLVNGSVFATI